MSLRRIWLRRRSVDPVDAHLGRRGVDQPLHEVVAFGPAGAAIGGDVRGVGEDAFRRDLDQRRAVHALHVLDDVERPRQRRDRRKERAHIGEASDAHREEVAVGVERELARDLVIAAVAVGDEAAGALIGPLDRPSERAGGVQQADIFGKYRGLHAERAADMAGEHAHILRRDAERLGDVGAHAEDALRADMKGEAVAVVGGERRARLHGVDHDAAVENVERVTCAALAKAALTASASP